MSEYPPMPPPPGQSPYEPPGPADSRAPGARFGRRLLAILALAAVAYAVLFMVLSRFLQDGLASIIGLGAALWLGRFLWTNFASLTRRHLGIPGWVFLVGAFIAFGGIFGESAADSASDPVEVAAGESTNASSSDTDSQSTPAPSATAPAISIPEIAFGAQGDFDDALRGAPINDELEFGFLGAVPLRLVSSFDASSRTLVFDADLKIPDAGSSLAHQVEFTFWENLAKSGEVASYTAILDQALIDAGVPTSKVAAWAVTSVRFSSELIDLRCSDLSALTSCVETARPSTAPNASAPIPPATTTPTPVPTAALPTPVPPTPVPPTPVPPTPVPPTPVPATPAPSTPVPPTPVPATPVPPPPTAIPQPQPAASSCHPSYTPCVPNSPTDLNCPDIGFMVQVIGADVYRLDRDKDGLGCESYG